MSSSQPPEKVDILLVDDQPANLLALESILEILGENLVRAASGEEARAPARRSRVRGGPAGRANAGPGRRRNRPRIRSREGSRHTPIIFLTAYGADEFPVVEAYRLGAVDYLIKPLIGDIVQAKVQVFVELFRHAREVPPAGSAAARRPPGTGPAASVGRARRGRPAGRPGPAGASLAACAAGRRRGLRVGPGCALAGRPLRPISRFGAACGGPTSARRRVRGRLPRQTFAPSEGLPGRVWISGEPLWVADLANEINFPRAPAAIRAGLRSAAQLPIRLGEQTIGVLEFFSEADRPADEDLLRELANIARQVGQSLAAPRRGSLARERGAIPPHGRRRSRAGVGRRHQQGLHLVQPPLAGVHRPLARPGIAQRLDRRCSPRRSRRLHDDLRRGIRRPRALHDAIPPAPPRRRASLDAGQRHPAARSRRRVRRLHRLVHGRGRAKAGGRGAARGRPPQGRVPGDARPRAAQPAGPHPQRLEILRGRRVRRPRTPALRHDRAAGRAAGPRWSTTCSTWPAIARGKIALPPRAGRAGATWSPTPSTTPAPPLERRGMRWTSTAAGRCGSRPTRSGWSRCSPTS